MLRIKNFISRQIRIVSQMRLETYVKIILMILSVCGLIYQVKIIYDQFMSGKTTVSIEIGRQFEQKLPAITICLPRLFSMERAGKISARFNKINQKYQQLLENKEHVLGWYLCLQNNTKTLPS